MKFSRQHKTGEYIAKVVIKVTYTGGCPDIQYCAKIGDIYGYRHDDPHDAALSAVLRWRNREAQKTQKVTILLEALEAIDEGRNAMEDYCTRHDIHEKENIEDLDNNSLRRLIARHALQEIKGQPT